MLKNVTFTDGRNSFHFDAHGDLNTGYDVVLWKETNGLMTVTKMAEYDLQRDVFITTNQETKHEFRKLKVIFVLGCFAEFRSNSVSPGKVLFSSRASSDR